MRTVKTATGKTAVQVVRYVAGKRRVVKHVGSADTEDGRRAFEAAAARYVGEHRVQQTIFRTARRLVDLDHVRLSSVTQRFAREMLARCAERCGLSFLQHFIRPLFSQGLAHPQLHV